MHKQQWKPVKEDNGKLSQAAREELHVLAVMALSDRCQYSLTPSITAFPRAAYLCQ